MLLLPVLARRLKLPALAMPKVVAQAEQAHGDAGVFSGPNPIWLSPDRPTPMCCCCRCYQLL